MARPYLRQPGPIAADRAVSAAGRAVRLTYELEPGRTLNDALTGPLAGYHAGALSFSGVALAPFAYVTSAPSSDDAHAAWWSETNRPRDGARLDVARATYGSRDGQAFVHIHARWTDNDGVRGGHIMPLETTVASAGTVHAFLVENAAISVVPDAETNFTIFEPAPVPPTPGAGAVAARIRPNEDIHAALAALCAQHGMQRARVHGIGSLVSPRFADGRAIADYATEFLFTDAVVTPDGARLDVIVADMAGIPHEGRLAQGENAVCITVEVSLEAI
jgi:predicted DNA-binding protein with PD1-like motif